MDGNDMVVVHWIERYVDERKGVFVYLCEEPECTFAIKRNIHTLEVLWKRPGPDGVQHQGGNAGLQIGMAVERPDDQ